MIDPVSLKDRCEATIVGLLNANPIIADIKPVPQNVDSPISNPRIVVVATPQGEYAPSTNLYKVTLAVELIMDLQKDQTGLSADSAEQLDQLAAGVYDVLETARALGTFGVIRNGETQTLQGLTRKRIINSTLITS